MLIGPHRWLCVGNIQYHVVVKSHFKLLQRGGRTAMAWRLTFSQLTNLQSE